MEYNLILPRNEEYSIQEQILVNRGIKYEDIEHYLNVTEEDNLGPKLLNNIDQAANILVKHIEKENNVIKVQVDSDCDGYTSAALLLNYVHKRWPEYIDKFVYSFHDGKVHGIDMDSIPDKTSLVIVPDASSNEYDKHKELADRGVEVLVLDHHQAEKVSEYACVVNNQLCDYPNKALSGVGIVYKLCKYLDSLYKNKIVRKFIDIVMLGLVGDMMDLRSFETHYLVQDGLKYFTNPFIRGMAEKNRFSLGDEPNPIGVAFYIVPFINSITRVGTMEEKTLLFESMLEWKAKELIPSTKRGEKGKEETKLEQTLRNCTNVKNKQGREEEKAVETIKKIIEEKDLLKHKVLMVQVEKPEYDKGITGLIANQLAAEYQRPVILLSKTEYEGKAAWVGSARGYDKSAVKDFKSIIKSSNLSYLAEG